MDQHNTNIGPPQTSSSQPPPETMSSTDKESVNNQLDANNHSAYTNGDGNAPNYLVQGIGIFIKVNHHNQDIREEIIKFNPSQPPAPPPPSPRPLTAILTEHNHSL